MKKDGIKLFIVALASFLMLVFCIIAAAPDSTLRFIDPTPADNTQEQDFTWGVLAINTHKSIYLPDETAFVGIAVLDNEGHMVCDADVTLTITDPSNIETVLSTGNGLINVSPQCCVYGVTNLPDFYTNYAVGGAGTYVMNLTVTAVTADGTKSITDVFTVQNSVDFDAARDGPTRIYPYAPYNMGFTINANKNYNGLINEYVPASFEITLQADLIITTINDIKILSWNKQLTKGEIYNLTYEFDAPDISPEFYLLGALDIGNWKEARQWQIASDADWYNANWTYRKPITIDHDKVNSALSNFPVLINLTSDSDLAADAQNDGDDLEEFENILTINVYEGEDKPYKCKDGFFLRIGPNSQKLKRDEIIENIQEAVNYVQKHINVEYEIKKLERKEIPQYPQEAIRECIVNAIMHRDYFDKSGDILVEVFKNKIMVSNLGGLVKWMKPEEFGTTSRIKKAMSNAKLPEPEFKFNGSFFATLYDKTYLGERVGVKVGERVGVKVGERLTINQIKILKEIDKDRFISAETLSEKVGISKRKIEENISKLKKMGLLKRIGPAKGGHWKVLK